LFEYLVCKVCIFFAEKPEDEEEEEADEENEENAKKDPPPRKLTELERLAWTVSTINNDTSVVPVGAWFMNPTGDVVKDQAYKGCFSLCILSSALFLRNPSIFRIDERASCRFVELSAAPGSSASFDVCSHPEARRR